jgi:hypothetical protein
MLPQEFLRLIEEIGVYLALSSKAISLAVEYYKIFTSKEENIAFKNEVN